MADELWQTKEEINYELSPINVTFTDPEGYWKARVKWDGCIDFEHIWNVPLKEGLTELEKHRQSVDSIHICDIDDMIKRLQALKAKTLEHFDGDWPR